MIRVFEYYLGVALRYVIVCARPHDVRIRLSDSRGRLNSYVLNDCVGLHIKHRSSRVAPWQFGFAVDTLEEMDRLRAEAPTIWLAFVCGEDGVVFLSEADFVSVNTTNVFGAYLRIDRDKRAMYRVSGSSGRLQKAVKRGALPLVTALRVGSQ
jgi:hypothetical protein